MELKKRLSKEVTVLAIFFILTILFVSISFFHLNNSLNNIITEAEPTQNAMEHMVQDVYRDNIVLLEYLNIEDYNSAVILDSKIKESSGLCREVQNDIENLIIMGLMTDQELISEYEDALLLHSQVEKIRDEIITLHKEELATGNDLSLQKKELLEEHSVVLDEAIGAFTSTAKKIQLNNDLLKDKILWQSKVFVLLVLSLIVIFIILTIRKLKDISLEVIAPIDNIIGATKSFVDGDFNSRISFSNKFVEIGELQNNINQVFSVINNETNKNLEKKKQIDLQLLKKEYVQILNYLKKNTENNVKTNISDLKKHLNVTHPTILERLNYLERRGFILLRKEGREKFISIIE